MYKNISTYGIVGKIQEEGIQMYKRVLVPLDGSELAECALSHVKALVKKGSIGEVVILNVVGIDIPWDEMDKGIDFGAFRQELINTAQKYLARIGSRLSTEGIKVKTEFIEATRPSHVIADYAQKNGIDMIIITTHGYTGMQKLLLGSVAFKVLHEARVPVLLIRPESCQV
jgi:nucleotide-binding universal stress UspA family protein